MSVSDIASHGWVQGSVLNSSTLSTVLPELSIDATDIGVLITHSCDLRHHDFEAEPSVELALAKKISSCSTEYLNVRHPRILDLVLGSGECYRFRAKDIVYFDREMLARIKPTESIKIAGALDQLLRWRSMRIIRLARPDAFNEAIRDQRRDLVRWLKKADAAVSEIRFRFDPKGEVHRGDQYQAQFILLASGTSGDLEKDEKLSRLASELSDILEICRIRPYGSYDRVTFGYLDEITVAAYREYLPFDMGDYLSATGPEYVW